MFVTGILAFSIIIPLVSYGVSRSLHQDPGKVATSLVLVSWGSLMAGLFLGRM